MELKNRRLKWSIGRTVNMGNFEFTRLDISEEADIPDGVDIHAGFSAIVSDVVKQLSVAETAIRGGKDPLPIPQEESLYEEEEDGT